MPAKFRTQSGLRGEARISNISAQGCCMTPKAVLLHVDARVVIRPVGMEGLTGVVRWTDGHRAGVEFDSPLYEPVVDHLAECYGDGALIEFAVC